MFRYVIVDAGCKYLEQTAAAGASERCSTFHAAHSSASESVFSAFGLLMQLDLTSSRIEIHFILPYRTGKACYRLALRPPVGPVRIPKLIRRLLKPLGVFSKLQEWDPMFLS